MQNSQPTKKVSMIEQFSRFKELKKKAKENVKIKADIPKEKRPA